MNSNNIFPSMQNTLINLAEQIVKGGENGPQSNLHFKNLINQVRNLEQCLYCIGVSDTYTFVYCTNMIKLIESGEFCIISETKSEENIINLTDSLNNTKVKVYGQIISVLITAILANNKPGYITKTIIDLIALCLKALFEDSSFFPYLQKTINVFMPNYALIESFNTATETTLSFITPRYNLEYSSLTSYCLLVQILSSMFEYITVQSCAKTYYEYRRNIYIFRNSYLAYFLLFTVQNCKILFQNFINNDGLRIVIKLTIQLLENIFLYPFTLSLHEFQIEEDNLDNISSGGSNDLYFPNYFRHVICDVSFIEHIWKYTQLLINNEEPFDKKRQELNSLTKILGRACCPSQYTFKNDDEKQVCREFAIGFIQQLCAQFRYYDSYYLNTIIDILQKMGSMFDYYFTTSRTVIFNAALNFIYQVVQNVEIQIEEGKRSPFAKAFELISLCLEQTKDKIEQENTLEIKIKCQQILEKAFERMLGKQANDIIRNYGINQPGQIQCFSELFQFIPPAFQYNLETNLHFMNQIDLNRLSPGAVTMWLHLCAQLLPKTTASYYQTEIILKYYELAKNGDSLASLRYIRTFAEQVMADFTKGEPNTAIWAHIKEITSVSFQAFIMCIIKICIKNFNINNNEILDYSLDFFKSLYTTLKRNDDSTFQNFYKVVNQLLQHIQQTVFSNPKYFHKRRQFFNVISVIWINSQNIDYIYQIYNLVSANLTSNTPQSFFQYLHDITGLIQPLDLHLAFEVLTELVLIDLSKLFTQHLNDVNKINIYFRDAAFVKILCKLIYALISDINRKLFFETHTKIPLKIHNLIFNYIKILASGEYQFPKNFASILQRMVNLNPLSPLVAFPNIVKILKEQTPEGFQKLVRTYFDHIHRLQDNEWMFNLIESNSDYMVSWWEDAMVRNQHPKVNFKIIAESRFWSTTRQKETFAKLLFELAFYDKEYWAVDCAQGERAFVEQFARVYG